MKPQNSSSPKILVIHATAGAGHRKAAEAIHHGLSARHITTAMIVDALDYTSAFFRCGYSKGYEFMVAEMPTFWAGFFWLTDQAWFLPFFRAGRRFYNGINTHRLVSYLRQEKFDRIVITHFLSAEVCGYLKRTGQIDSRLIVVVTDFDVHKIWLIEGVDEYCVASEYTRERLMALGVGAERITVTGIPLDEKFTRLREKKEIRRKLGLDADAFTVLISTSSFGFGPIEQLAEYLEQLQLIVICGNNQALRQRMEARGNRRHKICGFVDNMEEMMAASDVMVTKPGGLSVTEALANNLPMVFFSAIPGQEAGNVRVLAANGIGLSGMPLRDLASEVLGLSASPAALMAAREKTKRLAKPNSVEDIISRLVL
ncbi:MAG: glycosyltransferase [Candidatus Omnitrophota bacterium]